MATIPLTEQRSARWERPECPRLVLEDCTQETPTATKRPRTRRIVSRRWENALFAVAAAAVLLFFLINFALSLYHSAASSYQSPLTSVAVLPVKVQSGDTLWTYAQKYGAPNVYILDRVETIARANHMASDSPLVPGQRLLVPVTNPVQLAKLERTHLLASR